MPGIVTCRTAAGAEPNTREGAEEPTRERALQYMRAHPSPWRAGSLARKLRTPEHSLRRALSQLRDEGLLVSCTVTLRKGSPEDEYRIAAHTALANLHKFVINSKSIVGRSGAKPKRKAKGGSR